MVRFLVGLSTVKVFNILSEKFSIFSASLARKYLCNPTSEV